MDTQPYRTAAKPRGGVREALRSHPEWAAGSEDFKRAVFWTGSVGALAPAKPREI